jgi:hypothetical protein
MEFLFFWIIVAVVCALVAGHKNRSPVGWFFLGFAFSLFALAVLACLPKLRGPEQVIVTQYVPTTPATAPSSEAEAAAAAEMHRFPAPGNVHSSIR